VDADDPLWTELQGRYRPERPLGAGGMAEVWLVHDERHGRLVALKLLGEHLASAMGQDRFKREIALLARLQHPNVLSLIDSGENAGRMWYVTPFIEGESLRDLLDREGKLDITEALRLGSELLDALGYAHRSGVVHRDIKPENVLLSQGHALLADFGIAREEGKDRLTATGLSVGTPSYMSPEQVAGEQADASSDLYSMGCVLFECLTGQPPFVGPDARAVMAQHVMDPVPSLRARRPTVPEGVERVVLRALEKDPKDRWPDAAAFARALSEPTTSKANLVPSGIRPARPRARARRRLLVAAGVIVAIAVAAGGVTLWRSRGKIAVGPKVTLRQVTFRGDVCSSVISPNGQHVAFFAAHQHWLLDIERGRSWPVSDTIQGGDCHWAYWRADNSGFLYVDRDSIWLAITSGGKASVLGPRSRWEVERLKGASGRALDVTDTGVTVRDPGRPPRMLPVAGFRRYLWAVMSQDGSRALASILRNDSTHGYALVDLNSGRVSVLDSADVDAANVRMYPDGAALLAIPYSHGGLLRIDVDARRLRVTRRRTLLLPGLDRRFEQNYTLASGRNRIALYGSGAAFRAVVGQLPSADARARFSFRLVAPGSLMPQSVSLSPAGDRLFFTAIVDSVAGLFEMTLPGGEPRRVALLPGTEATALRLSSDGSTAIVATRQGWGDNWHATLVDVRSGRVRNLAGWNPQEYRGEPIFDWDPTGRAVYADEVADRHYRIIRLNALTGTVDTVRPDTTSFLSCPAASPDGKWLAVRSQAGQDGAVRIISLAGDSEHLVPLVRNQGYPCPIGWLNARQLAVLEQRQDDSSEIWLYDQGGRRKLLGRLPPVCNLPALTPSRDAVVCIVESGTGDVWIADDFDPYFRPPPTPKRP
jgi:tRNA A-37 threonylcarbamoyl transferase component Bud32